MVVARNLNSQNHMAALIEKAYGPIHEDRVLSKKLLNSLYWRGELALLNKDSAAAEALSTRGLNFAESSGEREYLKLWETRYSLQRGNAYMLQGYPSRALPILTGVTQAATEMYDPISPDLLIAKTALANCYLVLGQRANSAKLLGKLSRSVGCKSI
jgi:hypothetical protein